MAACPIGPGWFGCTAIAPVFIGPFCRDVSASLPRRLERQIAGSIRRSSWPHWSHSLCSCGLAGETWTLATREALIHSPPQRRAGRRSLMLKAFLSGLPVSAVLDQYFPSSSIPTAALMGPTRLRPGGDLPVERGSPEPQQPESRTDARNSRCFGVDAAVAAPGSPTPPSPCGS